MEVALSAASWPTFFRTPLTVRKCGEKLLISASSIHRFAIRAADEGTGSVYSVAALLVIFTIFNTLDNYTVIQIYLSY
jgi:hypothetical protein